MSELFEKYTLQAKRTLSTDILKTEEETVSMLCMGLAGETGEVVDYLKKIIFHKHTFNREILIKELGDMMWYFALLCDLYCINIEEVLQKNIEKLKIRYPSGFTISDSINNRNREKDK